MSSLDTSDKPKIKLDSSKRSNSIEKVGLMGPFGGGNLGDAAIQTSMIANLRKLNPKLEVYGFSIEPNDTESRHGIKSYPINKAANSVDYGWWRGTSKSSFASKLTDFWLEWKKNTNNLLLRKVGSKIATSILEVLAWFRSYRSLKQLDLDLLIVSGGGQLDDYWKGAWGHPFTLLRWCLFAKLNGTKFLIVSVGAAPIDRSLSKLFTRTTLTLADYRSYRDKDSKKYIERVVGFQKDDPVFTDLAFSLPIESYRQSPQDNRHRGIVGIGPMSYCNPNSAWPEKDGEIYSGYLQKLSDFAVWLSDRNYALALFPGQTAHDKSAIKDFKALLLQKGVKEEFIIERGILTIDDLMNQLVDLDFAIASRFHGVLLSLLLNKPTLALSYHPKIDALMEDTAQTEYCLKIDEFEVDVMKAKFNSIVDNRQQIKEQIANKTQAYKSSLAKQYDYIFQNF